MKILIKTAAVVAMSTFAFGAMAQQSGGVKVGGDVNIDVKTKTVTTTALGKDATAETQIGTIASGTDIGGDADIKVETGTVTTTAIGKNTCAKTQIGSVGTTGCD